jgi:Ferritin-like domain
MLWNRIMRAAAVRRALPLAVAAMAAAVALSACGGGGGSDSSAEAEKASDAAVLNEVLSRQTAAVAAYDQALHGLGGPSLSFARLFRAQEQEHIDATLKSLHGLGGDAEPEPEPIESGELKVEAEYLAFLYELENTTIAAELGAIARLNSPSARSMLAATAANQGEHLLLLRRQLGAKSAELLPSPFEDGTTPAP